jgi:hypothetical protein
VTLSIGIVASFFSAIYVTRTFFLLYLAVARLRIPSASEPRPHETLRGRDYPLHRAAPEGVRRLGRRSPRRHRAMVLQRRQHRVLAELRRGLHRRLAGPGPLRTPTSTDQVRGGAGGAGRRHPLRRRARTSSSSGRPCRQRTSTSTAVRRRSLEAQIAEAVRRGRSRSCAPSWSVPRSGRSSSSKALLAILFSFIADADLHRHPLRVAVRRGGDHRDGARHPDHARASWPLFRVEISLPRWRRS